jgi:hypothetical protein
MLLGSFDAECGNSVTRHPPPDSPIAPADKAHPPNIGDKHPAPLIIAAQDLQDRDGVLH